MSLHSLDRKLAAALKAVRKDAAKSGAASLKFREIRSHVLDSQLGAVLDQVAREVTSPVEARTKAESQFLVGTLTVLRDRGLPQVQCLLFDVWQEVLTELPQDCILSLASTAQALERWRKAKPVPVAELTKELLVEPQTTYSTAGADWLLTNGNPSDFGHILGFLLDRRPRPKFLPGWAEAIEGALKKDKKGKVLEILLQISADNPGRLETLCEVARLNPSLLRSLLENLPNHLSRNGDPAAFAAFVEQLFSNIADSGGSEREFLSATVARLGTGIILAGRRTPAGDAVLKAIANIARRLRNFTTDEKLAARTWVLENLLSGTEKPTADSRVSVNGAREIALAFESASRGVPATDVLRVLAQNLGLQPIGCAGDVTIYDPLQHQDLDGGMLPGDQGVIEATGWAYGREVVRRAKIRKGTHHV